MDHLESEPAPAALRHAADMSPPVVALTVQDMITMYEELHIPNLTAPESTQCRIRRYFLAPVADLPALATLPLESLTVPVIQRWVNAIRLHSKTQAHGCVKLLRSMIRKATIEWNLWKQPFNPAAVIATGKKPAPRKRYVMEQEFPTLIREIEREPVFIRLYFYLVMFTGPRPGEVEHAKQAHFHVMPDGSVLWHKPITKTDEHYIMLPYCLPELIRRHMAVLQPSQWLFPGRKGQCLSKEFWNARWVEIRDRCKMHDVQLRDLRRTCATDLLNDEENPMDLISLSKGVLNHSNLNTTTVYARPKMEKVGRHLDARMRKVLGKAGVRYDG